LNEDEKVVMIERVRDNRTDVVNKEFTKCLLVKALKDALVYYLFFDALFCIVPDSGVSVASSFSSAHSPPPSFNRAGELAGFFLNEILKFWSADAASVIE
jgi:hypothetical protein